MTRQSDILGRHPVMRAKREAAIEAPDDWRGEDKIKIRSKSENGGVAYAAKVAKTQIGMAKMRDRRNRVANLYRKGLNQYEIARELGCAQTTVSADLRAMGMMG